GHRRPALDAGGAAGARPVPVAAREGVRGGRAQPGGAGAAPGGPPHPAERARPRDRGRHHRRGGGHHRGVVAVVFGPRLPARHPYLGAHPLRRQGQSRLRAALGGLPGDGDLPDRALDQLHRGRAPRRARPTEGARTVKDLCWTPATELVALIRRRKVSPLDVTRAVLERIERVNPPLNAYCTVAAEQALAAATKATAVMGKKTATLGPLHGVPVSIKDLAPTKGIRTTWG